MAIEDSAGEGTTEINTSRQELNEVLGYIARECGKVVTSEQQVVGALKNLGYEPFGGHPRFMRKGTQLEKGDTRIELFETLIGEKSTRPVVELRFYGPCFHANKFLEQKVA